MKLMPWGAAQSACAYASASGVCSPQVIVPRQRSETHKAVPRRNRSFIARWEFSRNAA
jgi:hypothetical protein